MTAKPTVEELGIDVAAQRWQRSGEGDGTIEVAMVTGPGQPGADWVLMRVAAGPRSPARILREINICDSQLR